MIYLSTIIAVAAMFWRYRVFRQRVKENARLRDYNKRLLEIQREILLAAEKP